MTRDDVLDLLDSLVSLKRRRIDRAHVPVQFMANGRIAVVLPAEPFVADEQIKLDGKFQFLMRQKHDVPAFLDFTEDWAGLDTRMAQGMT